MFTRLECSNDLSQLANVFILRSGFAIKLSPGLWFSLKLTLLNRFGIHLLYFIGMKQLYFDETFVEMFKKCIRRFPSLSELTPIVFNMELTYLSSEASIYTRYF